MAPKEAIGAPPFDELGTVKGVALFEGEFSWVFWVCLVGYCAANCAAILKANKDIRFVHGLVLLVLNSYGGSTIAAIVCGQPVPFVVNEKLIVGLVGTWIVAFSLPGLPKMVKSTAIGSVLISVCFEVLRCHVMINCHTMAMGVLSAGWLGAVPIIGPLIAGSIGGCGGGFFPLDKGLKPLEAETAWRVTSSFYGALCLTLMDPALFGKRVAENVPLLADAGYLRFFVICFFVLTPLLSTAVGANPLGNNPLVGQPAEPAFLANQTKKNKKTD
jgi:hypothetical protein